MSLFTINFSCYIPGIFQSKQLQFSICLESLEKKMNHFMITLYQKAQETIKKSLCRLENTSETPLTGSTPYLPSENIVNTSENMENVRPLSVKNSRTRLENYIGEKYDQVAINYLKKKKN